MATTTTSGGTDGAGPAPPIVRELPRPPARRQVGVLRQLFVDPQPVLDDLRAAYGPVCGLGAGPMRMAVVGDPAALADLFAQPTTSFRWGHPFNVLGFVVGPGSMIVSDGEDHRRRRASVQAAFSRRRLNGWIPMILDEADAAVEGTLAGVTRLGGQPVDLAPVGRRLVLHVVVRAFFGDGLAPRADEIGALFMRPSAYLESPALRQLPHPLPRTRRAAVRADRAALDAIVDAAITDRRAHPTGNPLDVLEVLVEDGTLDDGEIRDQVVTLIGAGHDTTAASLSWSLWRAATTPGLWAALRDEADRVLGPLEPADRPGAGSGGRSSGRGVAPASAGHADHTTLAALGLAERVVHETLRLHPAGVVSPRQAVEDVVVAGYRIPAGTLVLWSAYLAGRDPDTWTDPLRFDPDRFLDPSPEQAAAQRAAWVPFGRGARNCIGFALAQMELVLALSRLVQRLDVEPLHTELPPPVGMVVNRPAGGLPAVVRARPT